VRQFVWPQNITLEQTLSLAPCVVLDVGKATFKFIQYTTAKALAKSRTWRTVSAKAASHELAGREYTMTGPSLLLFDGRQTNKPILVGHPAVVAGLMGDMAAGLGFD
jgi:hypothetical protein